LIATLTLNPCLDNYIPVSGIEPDETTRSGNVLLYPGGKGINVSRAVNEMGGETVAFGLVGGEAGHTLTQLLFDQRVPVSLTPITGETRTCFIISDAGAEHQTRISPPGPHVNRSETRRLLSQIWGLKHRPDFLVCGGSVPPGIPTDIYVVIIEEARERGIRTILDSSGEYLRQGIRAKPFLVKPNVAEAEELLGQNLRTEKRIVNAGMEMVSGGVSIAVISRGEKGLIATTSSETVKAVPPRVKVNSTVGAGDCTVAGLAIALAQSKDLAGACRLAVAMGTAAVMSFGTGLAKKADVIRLLPDIDVSNLLTR
jgi:6-phosphofructokinase 2